jgi:hypothetical protein
MHSTSFGLRGSLSIPRRTGKDESVLNGRSREEVVYSELPLLSPRVGASPPNVIVGPFPMTARSSASGVKQFSGHPAPSPSMSTSDSKWMASQRAMERMARAQAAAKELEEQRDRERSHKMMTSFAERTDQLVKARQQIRRIEELLAVADTPLDGDGLDEEGPDGERSASLAGGAGMNETFLQLMSGAGGGKAADSHARVLRVLYEDDDEGGDNSDDDPMVYTNPKRMYERQKANERVKGNGVDDIDPQRTKQRYSGAYVEPPPAFSSSSISKIMEVVVVDAIEQRLATENILRVVTDPLQKLWKVGSLEGELARLQFHSERLQKYIAAAVEQVPHYYAGSRIIQDGAQEEVVLFRKSVFDLKDTVDGLERHVERQQNLNDTLRRKLEAMKEELVVKRFALQEGRTGPDSISGGSPPLPTLTPPVRPLSIEAERENNFTESTATGGSTPKASASVSASATMKDSSFDRSNSLGKQTGSIPVQPLAQIKSPRTTTSDSVSKAMEASRTPATNFGLDAPAGKVVKGSQEMPPEVEQEEPLIPSAVVWTWAMSRLRHHLIQRHTKLAAALILDGEGTHTALLEADEVSDPRALAEIGDELVALEYLIRDLAPKFAPTLDEMAPNVKHQARRTSILTQNDVPLLSRSDGTQRGMDPSFSLSRTATPPSREKDVAEYEKEVELSFSTSSKGQKRTLKRK